MSGDNYKKFGFTPKQVTDGSSIGPGEIGFQHLEPALYNEIRNIQLHKHTGNGSSRINLQDLDGYVPKLGIIWYSSDGSKKYRVQINNSGVFVITQIT